VMSLHEHSDGIPEELERQLQLAMLAIAAAGRGVIARRRQAVAEAELQSKATARALRAQLEDERRLAAANLQAVFDDAWWQTASAQDVLSTWQQAIAWREGDPSQHEPTIFDQAAGRIEHEARHRSGLDVVELLELAELQRLEHEDHAAVGRDDRERLVVDDAFGVADAEVTRASPEGFDDPRRRQHLQERLRASRVPEQAVEARTLADVGQACEPGQALASQPDASRAERPGRARTVARRLDRHR
jgi:hypothetical protein